MIDEYRPIIFILGLLSYLISARITHMSEEKEVFLTYTTSLGAFIVLGAFIYSFWIFPWWVPIVGFVAAIAIGGLLVGFWIGRGLERVGAIVLAILGFVCLGVGLIRF